MTNLIWLFLPGMLALGIITSYEDIKFGKIRNKWVVAGMIYTFLVYLSIAIFDWKNLQLSYFSELFVNLTFSAAVGFGLWYTQIWTAGDGKLFIAFSVLIPLSSYIIGYQKWFPSITLLVNIFVPSMVIIAMFILTKIRFRVLAKTIKSFFREFFNSKKIMDSALYLFAAFWLVQIVFSRISSSYLLMLILAFLAFSAFSKYRKIVYFPLIGVAILRIIIDRSIFSISFLLGFLALLFGWRLITTFVGGNLAKLEGKRARNNIPFAPFIFLGALLTILANGNILIAIINMLR